MPCSPAAGAMAWSLPREGELVGANLGMHREGDGGLVAEAGMCPHVGHEEDVSRLLVA